MSATIDEVDLLAPVSADAPCGPDLDAEGDPEFMNFMAAIEGQLPAAFFSFDRKSIDFDEANAVGEKLLARSHDIRLLILLAKLSILNKDVDRFAHWLVTLAQSLADHWDAVHPRSENGDFVARIAQLSTLNDGPVVVLPLQYAPLVETERDGVLNFRAQLVALGEVKPRDGDNLPNGVAIDKILLNGDMSRLAQTFKSLQGIKSSIGQIRTTLIERVGFEQTPSFEALSPLVDRMTSFIHAAVARRDPSIAAPMPMEEAPPAHADNSSGQTGEFASVAEVEAAPVAALGYFERMEPSSAAVPLISQTRQLLGKNLYEVMKLLTPNYADNARIFVGAEGAFTVSVNSVLANESVVAPPDRQRIPPAPSRAAALMLIDGVAAHMRLVEPSSPAPYLLDRAKALASRDFLSLLKDLLSEDALSNLKRGG
jgi:type VI secretion system protein ImpA